jgi:lipopolysaccharide export system permease protein
VNLLDRYIFKSVLGTCLGAVMLFTFVLTLGNVIRDLLAHVLAGQLPTMTLVRLVWLWVPAMAIYALPMGLLTGVLLTLGRLSADSEITAMRAAGISLARIARPVLVIGALAGGAALYINFESMPRARVSYEREFADALRANPMSFIIPKTFIRAFKGSVIYVGDRQGNVLRDVWLWQLDNQQRVVRLIRAESGRVDYDEATNSLVPTLSNTKTEERNPANPEDFSKSPKAPSAEKVEEVRLPLDSYFGHEGPRVKREWLTYDQLQAERAKLAALPAPAEKAQAKVALQEQMKLAIVYHDKVNLALAVFSFALIGVPLGIRISRRETSANLGLALGLVLSYYVLTVMVKWLDRHPEYRPDLLLWLPNVVFLALGVWMFTRIEQRK